MNIYRNYPGPGIEVDTISKLWLEEHSYKPTEETTELKGWPDPMARRWTDGLGEAWIGEKDE